MSVIETLKGSQEFERSPNEERERTLMAIFPERLQELRERAYTIKQVYLSHPSDPCEVRMREITRDNETYYEAALKGETSYEDGVRVRDEPVPGMRISKELFDYYVDQDDLPTVYKLRFDFSPGAAVDFYEDHAVVEIEDPAAGQAFFGQYPETQFVDITGDHQTSNEWLAHVNYRRTHDGHEALAPLPGLDTDAMVADILNARLESLTPLIISVGGRSGSGKSTIVRELRKKLAAIGLTSDVTSTDDYHRGKQWLEAHNNGQEWKHWDDEFVYKLDAMREDLDRYRMGEVIPKLYMNFVTQEPEVVGVIRPVDVLIVEGIYASSTELAPLSSVHYEMPTSFAASFWRRAKRDQIDRPLFGDIATSLMYNLTDAEPAYRTQLTERAAAGL